MVERERNYCFLLNPRKYNRNAGCRRHDNLYGIHGGGSERQRWAVDREFLRTMRSNSDPMAFPSYIGCLLFGWFFWNYHSTRWPWRGQLLRRFVKAGR
jgi:hypothetical protein